MKSDVLSLGRAVAVLRRIGGARRLCFQWTGGQHESQHDFDFLLKCLGQLALPIRYPSLLLSKQDCRCRMRSH